MNRDDLIRYSTRVDNRVIWVAKFYVGARSTIREAGRFLGVSKSTVHKYLTDPRCLPALDGVLAAQARAILDQNKFEAPYRAAEASAKCRKSRMRREANL